MNMYVHVPTWPNCEATVVCVCVECAQDTATKTDEFEGELHTLIMPFAPCKLRIDKQCY